MRQWRIDGALYGEKQSTVHPYGFEKLGKKSWLIEAENLDYAEAWLLYKHPRYFQGGSISEYPPREGGDFSMMPVPGSSYQKGYYENYKKREKAAKAIFEEMRSDGRIDVARFLRMVTHNDKIRSNRKLPSVEVEAEVNGITNEIEF